MQQLVPQNVVLTHHTHAAEHVVGVALTQCARPHMEDAYISVPDLYQDGSNVGLFALFDGHSSSLSSRLASEHLATMFKDHRPHTPSPLGFSEHTGLVRRVFLAFDSLLREIDMRRSIPVGGTTAVVCIISRFPEGRLCVDTACLGDSRAVLVRKNSTISETTDHKPHSPTERLRLQQVGGTVQVIQGVPRVVLERANGLGTCLSLSRAFGDFDFKTTPDGVLLPPEKQVVTCLPAVTRWVASDGDKLVLASDGLWDTVSSQKAAALTLGMQGFAEAEVARSLLMASSSPDNKCVLVVSLGKSNSPGDHPPTRMYPCPFLLEWNAMTHKWFIAFCQDHGITDAEADALRAGKVVTRT